MLNTPPTGLSSQGHCSCVSETQGPERAGGQVLLHWPYTAAVRSVRGQAPTCRGPRALLAQPGTFGLIIAAAAPFRRESPPEARSHFQNRDSLGTASFWSCHPRVPTPDTYTTCPPPQTMQLIKPSWLSHSGMPRRPMRPALCRSGGLLTVLLVECDRRAEGLRGLQLPCLPGRVEAGHRRRRSVHNECAHRLFCWFVCLFGCRVVDVATRWTRPGMVDRIYLQLPRQILYETTPTLPHEPPPRNHPLRPLLSERPIPRFRCRRQDYLRIPPRQQPPVTCCIVW